MTLRIFGCRKFSRILGERADRDLKEAEERFLARHRQVCAECRRSEQAEDLCLNLLRGSALEAEVAPQFEDRIIRRLRVQNVRESLNYWSPALVGAGIACLALFVTLHLAAASSQSPAHGQLPGGEANRIGAPKTLPNLEVNQVPHFDR